MAESPQTATQAPVPKAASSPPRTQLKVSAAQALTPPYEKPVCDIKTANSFAEKEAQANEARQKLHNINDAVDKAFDQHASPEVIEKLSTDGDALKHRMQESRDAAGKALDAALVCAAFPPEVAPKVPASPIAPKVSKPKAAAPKM